MATLDLAVLCDPLSRAPLEFRAQSLVGNGQRYHIEEGIPVFAPVPEALNRKYQRMYDRIAPLYDFAESAYQRIARRDLRAFLAAELEVRPHMRVLEVSIGTGANLRLLPQDAEIHGLDLSMGMLRACRRNLRRKHREAALYQGEAERLPFRDNTFDLVFHVGGINFFSDRRRALQEMLRVARPGSKLIVSDETQRVVTGIYRRIPYIKGFFQKRTTPVSSPTDLLPPNTTDVQVRTVNHDKLYCLTFRKPHPSDFALAL